MQGELLCVCPRLPWFPALCLKASPSSPHARALPQTLTMNNCQFVAFQGTRAAISYSTTSRTSPSQLLSNISLARIHISSFPDTLSSKTGEFKKLFNRSVNLNSRLQNASSGLLMVAITCKVYNSGHGRFCSDFVLTLSVSISPASPVVLCQSGAPSSSRTDQCICERVRFQNRPKSATIIEIGYFQD